MLLPGTNFSRSTIFVLSTSSAFTSSAVKVRNWPRLYSYPLRTSRLSISSPVPGSRPERDPGRGRGLVSIRAAIVGEEPPYRWRRTLLPSTPIRQVVLVHIDRRWLPHLVQANGFRAFVADLNGRIFQWLDRFGPLLTRSGGKPRRWPPTAFPKRTLRACSASRSRPCARIAVPSSTRVPPGPTQRSLTFCSTEFAAAPANRHSKTSAPASRPRSSG